MKVSIGVAGGNGECEDFAFCNEALVHDRVCVCSPGALCRIGVADGVGGNAGGMEAARMVVSRIADTDFSGMTVPQIRAFAQTLNRELIQYAAAVPGKAAMAAALTCVVSGAEGFCLIHAGNTRLYVMQGSYLKQLTRDHSTFQWLMDRGQYEAAQQCSRSEINCCFGGGDPRYAAQLEVRKLFGDPLPGAILLTSDGIHEYVDLDSMEDILAAAADDLDAIGSLMAAAADNGSTDDKTVIIVRR